MTETEKMQLKKLKCDDWLELLLLPPKDYQNLHKLSNLSRLPAQGVVEVSIQAHHHSPKMLRIQSYARELGVEIDLIFFHPKPFHKSLFPLDSVQLVFGTLKKSQNLEMIHAKIVQQSGIILPIFPKSALKQQEHLQLAQSLITEQSLKNSCLPHSLASHLLPLFHPDLSFYHSFCQHKAFPQASQKALKFVEIFLYLRTMQNKKQDFPAKLQCRGDYQPFIRSLPFTLTQGQSSAIASLSKSLQSSIASRVMIMGDVGCGKTIVILSCVMMAYPHKSILMAPTTILAKQLFEEAQRFLPQSLKIKLITSETESQSKKSGSYEGFDFIIGTQALLHRVEDLSDFALVMSDEQHRFGTMQRHRLEKFATQNGAKPHILQFSATPIPRTMAMLQSGQIQSLFITDTPFQKDINTRIIRKKDFPLLLEHIHKEIAQGHQIAIVYPLVEESESSTYSSLKEAQNYWFTHFSDVYSTYGSDKNKEQVIAEFRDKGNILLSTTMIEVGISLPRLSTIIIVGAERMGLATLHQLRGRVSRNGLKGYCFLWTKQESSQRLEEFSQTHNGFEIAELDLKYRKSGDVLQGKQQSGDAFVFFDPSSDETILQEAMRWLSGP